MTEKPDDDGDGWDLTPALKLSLIIGDVLQDNEHGGRLLALCPSV